MIPVIVPKTERLLATTWHQAFNSLYKAELIRNQGPWRGLDDLEMATVEYIDWYNNQRLHGELRPLGMGPHALADRVTRAGLRETVTPRSARAGR
jgi:transposase InsO family protein